MEIRNEDFEGMKVSKEKQVKIFLQHGMSDADYQDFYTEYGDNKTYLMTDIRSFLGY